MAMRPQHLPSGTRITDELAMGILARTYPTEKVKAVLKQTERASQRERDLPAHVMVYYVMALGLWMGVSCREVLRCLLSGVQWLLGPEHGYRVTGKSGITQARQRLGWEPLRKLHEEIVRPIAQCGSRGAWYRSWRLVTLDGSTMDVADSADNLRVFGRPPACRGASAYPQLRLVSLLENGTHVLFGTEMGSYCTSELALAEKVIARLHPGMLCLADRVFTGGQMWKRAAATGADLLWRCQMKMNFACVERLEDGSYLSYVYPRRQDRIRCPHNESRRIPVRIIEYRLRGGSEKDPFYRLLTTILDPQQAPARELAALYHERWKSKIRWTSSRCTYVEPRWCCAAKLPIWSDRSSMPSSCCISRFAVSCMKLHSA